LGLCVSLSTNDLRPTPFKHIRAAAQASYPRPSAAHCKTLSWPEIYFEIGKLTSARTFYDFEGNISELEVATEKMKQNWDKFFNEKRPS
jgi:hypothetical protein